MLIQDENIQLKITEYCDISLYTVNKFYYNDEERSKMVTQGFCFTIVSFKIL